MTLKELVFTWGKVFLVVKSCLLTFVDLSVQYIPIWRPIPLLALEFGLPNKIRK